MIHTHIWLLSLVLLLPLCALILLQVRRLGRHPEASFLKPFFFFLSCTVLYFFFSFFLTYLEINLPEVWSALLDRIAVGPILLTLTLNLIQLAGVFFFIRTVECLHAKKPFRWARVCLFTLSGLYLLLLSLRLLLPGKAWAIQLFLWLRLYPLRHLNLLLLLMLIQLYRQARSLTSPGAAVLARSFSVMLMIREGLDLFSTMLSELLSSGSPQAGMTAGLLGDALYLVLTIGLVYSWLKRYLMPHLAEQATADNRNDAIAQLAARSGLSDREAEIVQLVVGGKSNKEIAAALALSASTVKNHIYRIYQRLEINSRFELIERVERFRSDSLS